MKRTLIACLLALSMTASARTLEVGPFREFLTLEQAAAAATAGDTILLREGSHATGGFIENLQGNSSQWITIRAADGEEVIFSGGSQAFHLTDPAYLRIEGLIFEQQTGNGVNIDDGGSPETPAHHVIIKNCVWRSMNAVGNNDELKLSGLDVFAIQRCTFMNGSDSGSLVDMVGCHNGTFEFNHFENGGSNCIQAKGGSKSIMIDRNKFVNGGQRAINIGGSTGLQFFRPIDATYEASDIFVYSNIFEGSVAPIAFVGAVNSEVINNTIIRPERWAIRILQETVDTTRFQPCGNNTFRNNIVVTASTQPAINIGPNTAPTTFVFSHNLWFNPDNSSWVGPNTPVTEPMRIVNQDPQFADTLYHLSATSPARGKGYDALQPQRDYYNRLFPIPRSIGAVEYGESSVPGSKISPVMLFPNPAHAAVTISGAMGPIEIINLLGTPIWNGNVIGDISLDLSNWPSGPYLVRIGEETRLLLKE
jgi:hypothetical protein